METQELNTVNRKGQCSALPLEDAVDNNRICTIVVAIFQIKFHDWL